MKSYVSKALVALGLAAATFTLPYSAEAQGTAQLRIGDRRITYHRGSDGRVVFGVGKVGEGNTYRAITPEIKGRENQAREYQRRFRNEQRNRKPLVEFWQTPKR